MSTFLIVGASFYSLKEYLLSHGHDYYLLADPTNPSKSIDKSLSFPADFSSIDSVLSVAKEINAKSPIDGVFTIYEKYIRVTAHITEALGLPGLPIKAAKACTDKTLMREYFAKSAEKISPDFVTVNNEGDLKDFAKNHQFPLVLKPANLSKSLLVSKNHNLEELLANYHKTLSKAAEVYKKYAPHEQPKLLIEEFLEGSVHSVDCFVDNTGRVTVLEQVVDYQTGYDIGFDDNFHYSRLIPSELPTETIAAIRHIAEVGCKALGMKSSPAHVEIILTKDGPRIVEIGARTGGYRDRMHRLANGIDMNGNMLKVAMGKFPEVKTLRNEPCAVLELFPKEPGLFVGIENEEKLRQLPSLSYFTIRANPGDLVGKSSEGHKMCAIVILHNKDEKQFRKDLNFANEYVKVSTES